MKKLFVALCVATFALVGCSGDSSSSGPNDEPGVESSSSSGGEVTEPAEVTSSSSEKAKSSSSKEDNNARESSSSSSVIASSAKQSSSSGKGVAEGTSSSSRVSEKSSSSSHQSDRWSWDVSKEKRLNPDIDYGVMTDERDGKVYKTVKIGDQTWMAENLNYYKDSDLSVMNKSWCYGKADNKDSSTCDVGGRFYTWAAAIDSAKFANDAENPLDCGYDKYCDLTGTVQGICPDGWHLPNNTEWETLLTAVGGKSTTGTVLRSQTGWDDYLLDSGWFNGDGSDAFGFSALPVAEWDSTSHLYMRANSLGYHAYFWSVTERNKIKAFILLLSNYSEDAYLDTFHKEDGISVRCIKD